MADFENLLHGSSVCSFINKKHGFLSNKLY